MRDLFSKKIGYFKEPIPRDSEAPRVIYDNHNHASAYVSVFGAKVMMSSLFDVKGLGKMLKAKVAQAFHFYLCFATYFV